MYVGEFLKKSEEPFFHSCHVLSKSHSQQHIVRDWGGSKANPQNNGSQASPNHVAAIILLWLI